VLGIFPGAGRWRTCLPTRTSIFAWLCSMGGGRGDFRGHRDGAARVHWHECIKKRTPVRFADFAKHGRLHRGHRDGAARVLFCRSMARVAKTPWTTQEKNAGHWWPWVPQSTPKILLVKLFSTVRADLMPLFLLDCLHESCSQDSGGQCKHSNSENGDYACAELAHGGDRIHISISDGR
jgi:hypothetical protein